MTTLDAPDAASWRSPLLAIIRNLTVLVVLAVGVRGLSFVRDVFIADRFGRSEDLDVYLVALTLPLFLVVVVTESLGSALVPVYLRTVQTEGRAAASELLGKAGGINLGLLLGTAIAILVGARGIAVALASELGPDGVAELTRLLRLFVPLFVCAGVASFWTSIVNANERFWVVGIAPAAVPLGATAGVALVRHPSVGTLAFGTVAGFGVQALAVAVQAKRLHVPIVPKLPFGSEQLRSVLGEYWPLLMGALLMSSTQLIDQLMAVTLGPAAVSTLHFGNRVVAMVVGAGGAAIGTATFPRLSAIAGAGDLGRLRREVKHLLFLVIGLSTPLVVVVVLGSRPLTAALFERGAFTAVDSAAVARVQQFLVLQVPFYFAGILLSRLASAMRANRILLIGAAISVVTNVLLNWLFMSRWGVAGIALSTSCVYVIAASVLGAALRRRLTTE